MRNIRIAAITTAWELTTNDRIAVSSFGIEGIQGRQSILSQTFLKISRITKRSNATISDTSNTSGDYVTVYVRYGSSSSSERKHTFRADDDVLIALDLVDLQDGLASTTQEVELEPENVAKAEPCQCNVIHEDTSNVVVTQQPDRQPSVKRTCTYSSVNRSRLRRRLVRCISDVMNEECLEVDSEYLEADGEATGTKIEAADLEHDIDIDSLDRAQLFVEIEHVFGIRGSNLETSKIRTVGDRLDFLERHNAVEIDAGVYDDSDFEEDD